MKFEDKGLLEFYMGLPYVVCVQKDIEAGDYYVWCPELSGCSIRVKNLDNISWAIGYAKQKWIETAVQNGTPIPEPTSEYEYSGEFKLRIPKSLHKELKDKAKAQGVSLNKLCVDILNKGIK